MLPVTVVGSGMAGMALVRELRKRAPDCPITLITAESGEAYSKPMLSTALAQGQGPERLVQTRGEDWARSLQVTLHAGVRVDAIDLAARRLVAGAQYFPFDRLVLATGARPVDPGLGGDAADEVLSVNSLDDYRRFRERLTQARRVAILGGGLIGCEFANDLAAAGYAVDVIHPRAAPLERLLPLQAGEMIRDALARLGVDWHLQSRALTVTREAGRLVVTLDSGSRVTADVVLSAIGLRPETRLAREAGLDVGRGIRVDRRLQTAVEGIHALGDCAEVDGHVLPYVQPLLIQARALAAILCGEGRPLVYPVMPVMIKTPAMPAVALPAPDGVAAQWQTEWTADGLIASQTDAAGGLAGFALLGAATAERQRFAARIRPLFAVDGD